MYHLSMIRQLTAMTSAIGLSKSYLAWLLLVPLLVAVLGAGFLWRRRRFTGPSHVHRRYPRPGGRHVERRFGLVTDYLGEELGVKVEYVPSVNYAALVTAFEKGDVHLAWFGALTGVQARAVAPGAMAIAQRPRDTGFHSVFVSQNEPDTEAWMASRVRPLPSAAKAPPRAILCPGILSFKPE